MPNPSFETKISCPNAQDQLAYASPWFLPTANTADYYNACTSSYMDIPQNWYGFQYARTGDAYAGFVSYYGANGKEYIEAPLLDTLVAGKRYCVEFYVSLSDSSFDAISPIGAYFSNTLYNNQLIIENIPVTPQVNSPLQTPLSDVTGWTLIRGDFTASGGEKYIIIGTFSHDSDLTIDSTIRPRPNNMTKMAYYYIDDISVIEIADCLAGNNATICFNDSLQLGTSPDSAITYIWQPSSSLNDATIANPKASPSITTTYTLTQTECNVVSSSTVTVTVENNCNSAPAIFIPTILISNENLFITGLESNSQIEIFDAAGRTVFYSADYQNNFVAYNLAQGIYVTKLTRPTGDLITRKLCILKQ